MINNTLIASARFGLELVIKNELKLLGFKDIKSSNGKVFFRAQLSEIPRANIWLRSADRVFLKMGDFIAETFEELYEQCKALPWEGLIPENGAVIVNAKALKSTLRSDRSCQSIVKKSIVDRLTNKYHLEWLDESGPVFTVDVTIVRDNVLIALDTSGTGLHKRGYRQAAGDAPLKETLAAGLVLLSRWRKKEILIDPMCGSGTIPIEAAMIARNIAPGLQRSFAAEEWSIIDNKVWALTREAAQQEMKNDRDLSIFGYDLDAAGIEDSKNNALHAGVAKDITFEQKDVKELWIDRQFGSMITNPPYGRRMAEYRDLNQIYISLNKTFRRKKGWSIYVLTADSMFPKYFKRPGPDRVRKLYNGRIRVYYYQYYGNHV
jgi:putative N6-adenine-specific DNA methylase